MKTILLLLILSITALAQTEPTDWVAAWKQLKQEQGAAFDLNSPQVQEIIQGILALNSLSGPETDVLAKYYTEKDGKSAWVEVAKTIQQKSPFAAATVKAQTQNPLGWTQEMVDQNTGAASWAALSTNAPNELKLMVWNVVNNKIAAGVERRFFKEYRKALPIEEQITVTENQKNRLIAKLDRTEDENSWLVEVAADLIALRLN